MIVVKIEIWPRGNEERKRILGVATITNTRTQSLATKGREGSYNVRLSKFGGEGLWKSGTVSHFKRKSRGPWDLLYIALRSLVGDRNG